MIHDFGVNGSHARTTGTIDVTINKSSLTGCVQGSFSGVACEITLQPLEDIENGS